MASTIVNFDDFWADSMNLLKSFELTEDLKRTKGCSRRSESEERKNIKEDEENCSKLSGSNRRD
ncbi:hypothetical protein NPIL_502421, partial [Nephila pilipes]